MTGILFKLSDLFLLGFFYIDCFFYIFLKCVDYFFEIPRYVSCFC